MNEEALKRIEAEKKKRTGKLDLSELSLKAIPEEVAKMDWLTHIEASNNKIRDISPIQRLANLTEIIFWGNQISDISPIKSLGKLTQIYFDGNLISDISPIQGLTNLTSIYFPNNHIIDLSPIHELGNLTYINFGNNQITDISPIQGLGKLTKLVFDSNQITDISPIQGLEKLTYIYFNANKISDISPIKVLEKLTQIGFWDNQISHITSIQGLEKLTHINFGNNNISDISSIYTLRNLSHINFANNNISDISPIQGLGNLILIDFTGNQISDISPTHGLGKLSDIDFSQNQISDISPIQRLENLSHIYFDFNLITDITRFNFIKNLPELYIAVNNNPFEQTNNLVLELGENHYNVLLLALEKLEEAELQDSVAGYLPVKVLMIGNHGSGKSSLVHFFKRNNLKYTGDTTHILKIEAYKKHGNDLPMAYFYDFGGQDFYHGLYQAFLRKGLMTVMLWNEASNQNIKSEDSKGRAIRHYSVSYWLGLWKRSVDGTIVLVQSQKDVEHSKRISHSGRKHFIDDEVYVSLKKQAGKLDLKSHNTATLQYLKSTIDDYISKEQAKQAGGGRISRKYYDFITYIQKEAAKLDARSLNISQLKPNYKDVDEFRFNTEIEQLVLSGIILKYQDTVWLNPAAVVEKVHEILSKELIDKGIVSEEALKKIVGDEDLIGLLKDQKVIFRHEHGQNGPEYIIPNYLPLIESSGIDYDLMVFGLDNPLFVLKFEDFMPFGLINQLICHFGQLPDRKKFWRDQLVFTISKKDSDHIIHQAKILIKLNFDTLKLEVYAHFDKSCDNESFKNLVKEYIFYSILSFDDPNFSLPSFELYKNSISDINYFVNRNYNDDEKKIGYTISLCIKDSVFEELHVFNHLHDKHLHIYDANILISLNKKSFIRFSELLENNNKPTIKTYYEDLQFYREMPAYPYQAFTPHKIEKMKKVFISYSKDDLEIVMSYIHSLQTLVLQNTIDQPWFCTYLAPGDEVHNKIREKMQEADVVCFMCSNNFFRTQYIIDHELKPTLKRKNEGSQQIILPIVIDRVKWIIDNPEVNLGKYSGFPYRGKPVSSFYNWNDAWYVTNWFLEQVLKKNLVNNETFFDNISNLPSDIEELLKLQIKGDLNK